MIVSTFGFSDILGADHVVLDPSRIAAQVISGIGFIGAGTILLLKQGTIRGLTTASGLWTVAAIGLATGSGLYFAAGATTVIALIILWALQPLEQAYSQKFKQKTLRIVTKLNVNNTAILKILLDNTDLKIHTLSVERDDEESVFQLKFDSTDLTKIEDVIVELKKNRSIMEIFWTQ